MNKQQLMAEFEKSLAVLADSEDVPESEWAYADEEVQWNFYVFCEGFNCKEL